VVPAAPGYLRLARMTAAGLGSRLGFTYEDVEDLRIAVDELCFVLVGTEGRAGTIAMTFRCDDRTLVIDGTGHFEKDTGMPARPSQLSEQILDAVCDSHELQLTDPPRFMLRKRAGESSR